MRVLFIEDDDLNRRIVEDMLRVGGADMVGASDAGEGLRIFGEDRFDVVLVDLRMPAVDGFETMKRIRQWDDERRNVPLIVVTADTGERIDDECRAAGADAILLKPVAMRELFEVIADLVVSNPRPPAPPAA
ncbi:response regulator [Pacificimonas flava]|uniref:Sensor histidine kinase/response regulator n=1 Tax=Pacificimonas flava TaxID=1234595 RepID=M2T636_9SPHN|nr:response regulator [Pacificimonas flava]EMD81954.1 sensor histidine kinase/response regulator [Pacificimonas flava]MBB5280481.1 CheY-like chemotaxis protein [Pacificimonas flava]